MRNLTPDDLHVYCYAGMSLQSFVALCYAILHIYDPYIDDRTFSEACDRGIVFG